jgi:S-adenosylmethionine:tRNA ribosyltransferase-isomerase
MRAATAPIQRPADARLLVVPGSGAIEAVPRASLADRLRPGDLVVANDAATLPALLRGEGIEIRLAGRRSLAFEDVRAFTALAFGPGDHRTRTELRQAPPRLRPGDTLHLGPLRATVRRLLGHPRLLSLRFEGDPAEVWRGIAEHGRPVQYAHLAEPLALWDVWTPIAALPVAFEPPSAGFVLDWRLLADLDRRGVEFATLTHAAGLSSTGDPALDARLPLPEAYRIPAATVRALEAARARGGRVVAIGTTVTRALEHGAARPGGLRAGPGLATGKLGPGSRLRVVDALVSGAHAPGESHYSLLRAFAAEDVLARMSEALETGEFRTHEFGDSVLLEKGEG